MKSPEYAHVKHLIDTKFIVQDDLHLIFDHIRRATLQTDMHMSPKTLLKRIHDPGSFTIEELVKLADLINIDPALLTKWATTISQEKQKKKSRK